MARRSSGEPCESPNAGFARFFSGETEISRNALFKEGENYRFDR